MTLNKNGFTLIELIVAMVLIAILVGVAGPTLINAVPGISLKSAANDLASDMRMARSLAVKNQETVTLSFDTVAGSYQINSSTLNKTVVLSDFRGGIKFGAGAATKDATEDEEDFDGDFTFVSFQGPVEFSRNGLCNRYGYAYLCNENNDIAYAAGMSSRAGVVTFRKTNGTNSWTTL